MVGDVHDAEDLVQVALAKVVPRWSGIAHRPEPYVRTVLARESVTRWRTRRWRESPQASLPEKETAAALGIALGTVKSQTRDGLARLRVALGADVAGGV
ncbi:sigma factor [Nocardioides sp.]|uniref:sigma factor n=1 Tax=Nocardioides sp. TaxID=35761 RepID=UPI00321A9BFA